MGRRVVTGVSGCIGSSTAEVLLGDGHGVLGIDSMYEHDELAQERANLAILWEFSGFQSVEGGMNLDLADLPAPADVVFHLAPRAGVRSPWADESRSHIDNDYIGNRNYIDNNVEATQRLLEGATRIEFDKLVYASSCSIYGKIEGQAELAGAASGHG